LQDLSEHLLYNPLVLKLKT